MTTTKLDESAELHQSAYAAMDTGALTDASVAFAALLRNEPENASYHYMRGLAHKYLLDWPTSLHHNLRAIELSEEVGEAEHWNAAIAATALGEWSQTRRLWAACNVRVPEGAGPIEHDYGVAVVRLNPWGAGETLFARRIDPVRARLLNVPLPESGHRFGDIVLHDGAATGYRFDGEGEGEGEGRKVAVFNELARLTVSEFQTFVVFVSCASPDDLQALLDATAPGLGYAEDWTQSVTYHCLRCSYGTPHRHDTPKVGDWQPDRNLGIAAQSRKSVEKLLKAWVASSRNRSVDGIETRECKLPERVDGHVWWCGPDEEDSDEGASSEQV